MKFQMPELLPQLPENNSLENTQISIENLQISPVFNDLMLDIVYPEVPTLVPVAEAQFYQRKYLASSLLSPPKDSSY